METRVSVWDRIVWGAIAGTAGALVGGGAALVLMYEAQSLHFNRALVFFSAVYFFAVGFWKGPLAADLFGAALQGGSGYVQAELDGGLSRNVPGETIPTDRSITYLGLVYVLGAVACLLVG